MYSRLSLYYKCIQGYLFITDVFKVISLLQMYSMLSLYYKYIQVYIFITNVFKLISLLHMYSRLSLYYRCIQDYLFITDVFKLSLYYRWSITPMMYPTSFLFNEPSVAYICLIVINLFTGITCVICSFTLKLFDFDQVCFIFNFLPWYVLCFSLTLTSFSLYVYGQ